MAAAFLVPCESSDVSRVNDEDAVEAINTLVVVKARRGVALMADLQPRRGCPRQWCGEQAPTAEDVTQPRGDEVCSHQRAVRVCVWDVPRGCPQLGALEAEGSIDMTVAGASLVLEAEGAAEFLQQGDGSGIAVEIVAPQLSSSWDAAIEP